MPAYCSQPGRMTHSENGCFFLLQLPSGQRASLVNTALHEMELRGEPRPLREAFAILATESGANAALRVMKTT